MFAECSCFPPSTHKFKTNIVATEVRQLIATKFCTMVGNVSYFVMQV